MKTLIMTVVVMCYRNGSVSREQSCKQPNQSECVRFSSVRHVPEICAQQEYAKP
jgi:hypothetical protein